MPLDGTCASLDLLDRLVQEDFPGDEGNSGMAPRRFSHGQSSSPFAPEPSINEQVGHGAGEMKFSAPIIPPNVTPSLPDLLPRQRTGAPPLPVAAATARRGAREEVMMATDDLDVLAAKIKQILDEQARRHGIDV